MENFNESFQLWDWVSYPSSFFWSFETSKIFGASIFACLRNPFFVPFMIGHTKIFSRYKTWVNHISIPICHQYHIFILKISLNILKGGCLKYWNQYSNNFQTLVLKHIPSVPILDRPTRGALKKVGFNKWWWYLADT